MEGKNNIVSDYQSMFYEEEKKFYRPNWALSTKTIMREECELDRTWAHLLELEGENFCVVELFDGQRFEGTLGFESNPYHGVGHKVKMEIHDDWGNAQDSKVVPLKDIKLIQLAGARMSPELVYFNVTRNSDPNQPLKEIYADIMDAELEYRIRLYEDRLKDKRTERLKKIEKKYFSNAAKISLIVDSSKSIIPDALIQEWTRTLNENMNDKTLKKAIVIDAAFKTIKKLADINVVKSKRFMECDKILKDYDDDTYGKAMKIIAQFGTDGVEYYYSTPGLPQIDEDTFEMLQAVEMRNKVLFEEMFRERFLLPGMDIIPVDYYSKWIKFVEDSLCGSSESKMTCLSTTFNAMNIMNTQDITDDEKYDKINTMLKNSCMPNSVMKKTLEKIMLYTKDGIKYVSNSPQYRELFSQADDKHIYNLQKSNEVKFAKLEEAKSQSNCDYDNFTFANQLD